MMSWWRCFLPLSLFWMLWSHETVWEVSADRMAPSLSTTAARTFLKNVPNGWLRSIPALSKRHPGDKRSASAVEVSVTTKRKRPRPPKLDIDLDRIDQHLSSAGIYYGLTPSKVKDLASTHNRKPRVTVEQTMTLTLEELRGMRYEMEALRKELHDMRQSMMGTSSSGETPSVEVDPPKGPLSIMARKKRQREYDAIGADVERWADELLFEQDGEVDGWTEVQCNKVMRHMNSQGRTRAYLKWMKDSRGPHADLKDEREYPCLKAYATIDATLDEVCAYLAQEQKMTDYNDLILRHVDVEEVSPHSKICWGQTYQILFIKPREFLTYCQHRWLRDGTQVLVNQACHSESSIHLDESKGKNPWAYALRGASYIGRDPDDPEKTRISMVAHGSPGPDIPNWAMRSAVNAVAPIEPFKLFHKINQGVQKARPELISRLDEAEMVSQLPTGRSPRPAGMAQLGYACFWPNGGGLKEGWSHSTHSDQVHDSSEHNDNATGSSVPSRDERSEVLVSASD